MAGIEEAEGFTGFVLVVPGPDGRPRHINVSKDEYIRHRRLLPCVSRAETPHLVHKWEIF
jgi:hypothetical protein